MHEVIKGGLGASRVGPHSPRLLALSHHSDHRLRQPLHCLLDESGRPACRSVALEFQQFHNRLMRV